MFTKRFIQNQFLSCTKQTSISNRTVIDVTTVISVTIVFQNSHKEISKKSRLVYFQALEVYDCLTRFIQSVTNHEVFLFREEIGGAHPMLVGLLVEAQVANHQVFKRSPQTLFRVLGTGGR